MAGVLDGIRVLDFGRYIAGPFCAALLADLGAEVIRIERIGGGEDRGMIPIGAGSDGGGAMFLAMNRNKLGMTLDPAAPQGREIVRKLVATADIVVANLPPRVLRSLSLDLDSLRRAKLDIILTTVTGFGSGGPLSRKHGFDGIGQTMSGAVYLSGCPAHRSSRSPSRSRGSISAQPPCRRSARWRRSSSAARRVAARRSRAPCCAPRSPLPTRH